MCHDSAEKAKTNPTLPGDLLKYAAGSVQFELDSPDPWKGIDPNIQIQVIRALAFLYSKADTHFKGSAKIADSIRYLYKLLLDRGADNCTNRVLHQTAETRIFLAGVNAVDIVPGIDGFLEKAVVHYVQKLELYRYLTHFTAQNLDTGTNHVGMYVCAVYRTGEILRRDDLVQLALSTWDRVAADQHPDGYWAETTGGPATFYNHLTMCCAGRMAHWTGKALYHKVAQRAAAFHREFSYPDGSIIETIDGRTRYNHVPELFGDFVHSHTAQGRAFVGRKFATFNLLSRKHLSAKQIGERVSNLCENLELWVDGPAEEVDLDRPHYVHAISGPAAVRRHGAWVLPMQGMIHLPQGRGGFTLDRTSLFSIWNKSCGLIVNGSGEPGEHAAQNFHFPRIHEYDFCRYSIPEHTEIDMGTPGSSEPAVVKAEYRGGTAEIQVFFVSDEEIRICVKVGTRADFYPVLFTMQLELREGDSVNGVKLGWEKLELSGKELGNSIVTDKFAIRFQDEGAAFQWPHDPYNQYDRKGFKSHPSEYVSLLHIPVGPLGAEVTIRRNGQASEKL